MGKMRHHLIRGNSMVLKRKASVTLWLVEEEQ